MFSYTLDVFLFLELLWLWPSYAGEVSWHIELILWEQNRLYSYTDIHSSVNWLNDLPLGKMAPPLHQMKQDNSYTDFIVLSEIAVNIAKPLYWQC